MTHISVTKIEGWLKRTTYSKSPTVGRVATWPMTSRDPKRSRSWSPNIWASINLVRRVSESSQWPSYCSGPVWASTLLGVLRWEGGTCPLCRPGRHRYDSSSVLNWYCILTLTSWIGYLGYFIFDNLFYTFSYIILISYHIAFISSCLSRQHAHRPLQQHCPIFLLSGLNLNLKFLRFCSTILTSSPTLIRFHAWRLLREFVSVLIPATAYT